MNASPKDELLDGALRGIRPMRLEQRFWQAWVWIFISAQLAAAQTFLGSTLSHRSSGSGVGNWTLSENGYVGTYFTLDSPGPVTITARASGTTNDAVLPHMNLVVADTKVGFDVG